MEPCFGLACALLAMRQITRSNLVDNTLIDLGSECGPEAIVKGANRIIAVTNATFERRRLANPQINVTVHSVSG
jgi:hypothetical protein